MTEKLEDGRYEFTDMQGDTRQEYVKDGKASMWLRNGEPYKPSTIEGTCYGSPRRIADLDGKPVVDEGVVEAAAETIASESFNALGRCLDTSSIVAILRNHLSPTQPKQEQGAEHVLFKTGDPDAPNSILDRNGEVALALCRVCNRAEVELDEPCVQPPERPAVMPRDIEACGADAREWAQLFMKMNGHRLSQIDEGDMIGWFANAIEFSYTARMSKQSAELPHTATKTELEVVHDLLEDAVRQVNTLEPQLLQLGRALDPDMDTYDHEDVLAVARCQSGIVRAVQELAAAMDMDPEGGGLITAIEEAKAVWKECEDRPSNSDIEAERDRLKARIAELEAERNKLQGQLDGTVAALKLEYAAKPATPTTNRYRETATGDEWVFLPPDLEGHHRGLNLSTQKTGWTDADGLATKFTPIPAEEPIVRLPGAFVCWRDGEIHTAWEAVGDFSCPFGSIRHRDGMADYHTPVSFNKHFTRTPPTQLSPELEKFVQPLATALERQPEDVRKALATCAGG